MQGNGCTLWVGNGVTCRVVQTPRTMGTAYGLVERRQSASDPHVSYDHLNSRDLFWANAFYGRGCKDNVSIKQTFPVRPAFDESQAPLLSCACNSLRPANHWYNFLSFLLIQGCLAATRDPQVCMSMNTRRSTVTPNEANRFDVQDVQHFTEFFALVLFLVLEGHTPGVDDTPLDIKACSPLRRTCFVEPTAKVTQIFRKGRPTVSLTSFRL